MAHALALPLRAVGFAASRRAGRWLLAACSIALVLAAAYRLWLRDSSLVAVREVKVVGLSADNASRVRAALTGEALTMTTLHVRMDDLRAAVHPYPTVKALSVDRDLPHGLVIEVIEQAPGSVIRAGGRTVAIAPDGAVLDGIAAPDGLPRIAADAAPSGRRLGGAELDQALVLGGAPDALRSHVEGSSERDGKITVRLEGGVRLEFGEPVRIAAKWAAAARVLADPRVDQLAYLDLTVPERTAVGGTGLTPPPVTDSGAVPVDPGTAAVDPGSGAVDPATAPEPPVDPASTSP